MRFRDIQPCLFHLPAICRLFFFFFISRFSSQYSPILPPLFLSSFFPLSRLAWLHVSLAIMTSFQDSVTVASSAALRIVAYVFLRWIPASVCSTCASLQLRPALRTIAPVLAQRHLDPFRHLHPLLSHKLLHAVTIPGLGG